MTVPLATAGLVLAAGPFDAVRYRLARSGTSDELIYVGVALVSIAVFWSGVYLWDRWRQSASNRGSNLFEELCRAHGVAGEERATLTRAAKGLSHAATAFVDPGILDRFAASHPDDAPACTRLRDRLFGAEP